MAGDWIKVEHALPDKPECIRVAAHLGIDQDAVTGKLVRLWIWADQQTIDGNAPGVTSAFIDRLTNCPGFAAALVSVGWLEDRNGRLKLPNFDRHNGQTAKDRALTKDRVKRSRNGASVTGSLPEKRREEKNNKEPPPAPPERPIGLLLDPEEFLAAWNANAHTRKAGPTAANIPRPDLLQARLANPVWVEDYPRALAKLPLRGHTEPTISIKWFLEENTVALILSGEWDYDAKPRAAPRAAKSQAAQSTVSDALREMREKGTQ